MKALLAALLLLVAAGAATAGEPSERAEGRRRFQVGEQHYRRGEYLAALEQYEAGYRLTRLPGFLINMGHCYRLSGDARRARATYRKYLLVEPASPHKAEIEELIRSLDRVVAASAPEPAEPRKPRLPSPRWWLWSALAASVVGTTVATQAVTGADGE